MKTGSDTDRSLLTQFANQTT